MLKVLLRQRTGLNVRAKFSLQLDMTEVKKCDSNFTQYNYPRIDSSQPRFADLYSCDKSDPIGIVRDTPLALLLFNCRDPRQAFTNAKVRTPRSNFVSKLPNRAMKSF